MHLLSKLTDLLTLANTVISVIVHIHMIIYIGLVEKETIYIIIILILSVITWWWAKCIAALIIVGCIKVIVIVVALYIVTLMIFGYWHCIWNFNFHYNFHQFDDFFFALSSIHHKDVWHLDELGKDHWVWCDFMHFSFDLVHYISFSLTLAILLAVALLVLILIAILVFIISEVVAIVIIIALSFIVIVIVIVGWLQFLPFDGSCIIWCLQDFVQLVTAMILMIFVLLSNNRAAMST